jgi:hypothetical protein
MPDKQQQPAGEIQPAVLFVYSLVLAFEIIAGFDCENLQQHTFLSNHPDPEARAKRLLQKENTEEEDQNSILEKVLQYGQRIVIGLFELILTLIRWVISLL